MFIKGLFLFTLRAFRFRFMISNIRIAVTGRTSLDTYANPYREFLIL